MSDHLEISTLRQAVAAMLGALARGCEFPPKIDADLVTVWEAELSECDMRDLMPAARLYMKSHPKWPGVARIVELVQHVREDRRRAEIAAAQEANRNAPALPGQTVGEELRASVREMLGITPADVRRHAYRRECDLGINVRPSFEELTA